MPAKKTLSELQAAFAAEGCVLLEDHYIGALNPMKYLCCCGTESRISWNNFRAGTRCQECNKAEMKTTRNPKWNPNREEVRVNKMVRQRYYRWLYHVLKLNGSKKTTKSCTILGYTSAQLTEHLKNHPHWNVVKDLEWHIDHIFPIKAFMDYGLTDPKLVNALDNLRPTLATHNLVKGASYCAAEFETWLKGKGIL